MAYHCLDRAPASEFGLGFASAVSRGAFLGRIRDLYSCSANFLPAAKTSITKSALWPFASYCLHPDQEAGKDSGHHIHYARFERLQ